MKPSIEDLIAAIDAASEAEIDDVLRALLGDVGGAMTSRLGALMSQAAHESLASETAGTLGYDSLLDAHARAAYLGRRMAGNDVPFGDYDNTFGALMADEQAIYLDGFLSDIADGKYTLEDGSINVEAIEARAEMYDLSLRGTANEAFSNTLDPDDVIYWELGSTEQHCGTCEDLAARSPYRPSEMMTYPGDGATECSIGCDCGLRTESGKTGF